MKFFIVGIVVLFCFSLALSADKSALTKVLAQNGNVTDFFGCSVAISGNRAIVGACGISPNGGAYIYRWDGKQWVEEQRLLPTDGGRASCYFGNSVSISGNRAVVGAYYDNDKGNYSGSVYVYTWNGERWEGEKLLAPDGMENAHFGASVAISGDRFVVGANRDGFDLATISFYGAAYVFTQRGAGWSSQKLTPGRRISGSDFGTSVAISGDRIIVGAQDESSNGAAYIFSFDGNRWIEEKVVASDGANGDCFGRDVAISGDVAVVGAHKHDEKGSNAGAVYLYTRSGTGWKEEKIVPASLKAGDQFGEHLSISGTTLLVGAEDTDSNVEGSGAAYRFSGKSGAWKLEAIITAPKKEAFTLFGHDVSIDDKENIIIGAIHDNDKGQRAGAVYFNR